MKNFILLFFVFYCLIPHAQSIRNTQTGLFGRTGSYSAHADASDFQSNQASLAALQQFSSSFYSERRFLVNELSHYRLTAVFPTSGGNFGISLNHLGGNIYSEIFSAIGYARRMGKVDVGVQFNHFLTKTNGYGQESAVNFELGFIYHFTEQIHAGAHIYNPTGIKRTDVKSGSFPVIYSAGIGYDVSENFFAGCIIKKESFQPVSIDVAVKYVFEKKLFARLGLETNTSSFSFGTGIVLNKFRFELLTSLHPQLGITPAILFVYHPIIKK